MRIFGFMQESAATGMDMDDERAAVKKFTLIRIEACLLGSKPAVAVFFEEVTEYVRALQVESEWLEGKNRADN